MVGGVGRVGRAGRVGRVGRAGRTGRVREEIGRLIVQAPRLGCLVSICRPAYSLPEKCNKNKMEK